VNIIKRRRLDAEVPTTVDLPTLIRLVVRHFRHVHGLATWRDVAKAVLEAKKPREASRPEGNDIGVKLLRHSGEATQLVRLVVHRLMDVGLRGLGKFTGAVFAMVTLVAPLTPWHT